jgi:hypothetical protein
MSYKLPAFNLNANIWRYAAGVPGGAPVGVASVCLAWGRRVAAPFSGGTAELGIVAVSPTALFPIGTDVRDGGDGAGQDIVEIPAGTGRYYYCVFVDSIGRGFLNEHIGCVLNKTWQLGGAAWPSVIP